MVLDHIAYLVADIRDVAARMRRQGARFTTPDGRHDVTEPIELDGVLHLWTAPESSAIPTTQLVQAQV